MHLPHHVRQEVNSFSILDPISEAKFTTTRRREVAFHSYLNVKKQLAAL